jgi:hypothetical protein
MEVPVGFSKLNPKKHKVLFPLANVILNTAKFLEPTARRTKRAPTQAQN